MGWYAIFRCFGIQYGLVAQLAVHVLGKHEVGSSSLPETSRKAIHTLLTLGVQRFGVALGWATSGRVSLRVKARPPLAEVK